MSKLVRIKPLNPRRGFKAQTRVIDSIVYRLGHWYEVNDDTAAYLSTVLNIESDPDSQPVFDVVDDLTGAEALDEAEKRRAEQAAAPAARPIRVSSVSARDDRTMTTRDLPRVRDPGGTVDDLDSADLAAEVSRRDPRPRAKRILDPMDPDGTVVEGDPLDDEAQPRVVRATAAGVASKPIPGAPSRTRATRSAKITP